ncbi:MAG: MTH938/NDUFAF3 family protein [Wenzhouxiangellaceae bacterium]|nr:MTH938/NDUFAF3 family protein [Wenzhouxiangellaceae bacterium]
MQLTEHRPEGQAFVHSLHDDRIRIVDRDWRRSLLLSPGDGARPWAVESLDDVDAEALAPVFEARPDVVLLATGRSLRFPPPDLQVAFLERAIGLEVMTLDAAARTFNVLASEGRDVIAAMIWESGG